MSLRDTLQAAITPVVKNLVTELGDTVVIARATATRQRDNSTRRTWAAVPGLIKVPGQVTDVSLARAQELWGEATEATATGKVPTDIPILREDVIAVQSGPFTGRQFVIDDLRFDIISTSYSLALREAVPKVTITGA